jgi:hypothetical protein
MSGASGTKVMPKYRASMTSMRNRRGWIEASFWGVSVLLLVVTAAGKLLAAASDRTVWTTANPVLGLPEGWVLMAAVFLELTVALLLVIGTPGKVKAWLLLWLCFVFTCYRLLGSFAAAPRQACPCLGVLRSVAGLSPAQADGLAVASLIYLILSSVAYLGKERWKRRMSGGGLQGTLREGV